MDRPWWNPDVDIVGRALCGPPGLARKAPENLGAPRRSRRATQGPPYNGITNAYPRNRMTCPSFHPCHVEEAVAGAGRHIPTHRPGWRRKACRWRSMRGEMSPPPQTVVRGRCGGASADVYVPTIQPDPVLRRGEVQQDRPEFGGLGDHYVVTARKQLMIVKPKRMSALGMRHEGVLRGQDVRLRQAGPGAPVSAIGCWNVP